MQLHARDRKRFSVLAALRSSPYLMAWININNQSSQIGIDRHGTSRSTRVHNDFIYFTIHQSVLKIGPKQESESLQEVRILDEGR